MITPGYYSHTPAPALAAVVDHFWMLEQFSAPARQMIVPDGGLELILNLGDPQRVHDRQVLERFTTYRDCWISGLRREPIVIGTPGPMSIIGVRFRAFGAYRVLGVPLHDLSDRVTDAAQVVGNQLVRLRDEIGDAQTPERRFALFEMFLLQRITEPARSEPQIRAAVEAISHVRFDGRVEGLADHLNLSPKHLRRLFRDAVGLSPKALFQVYRFQRVLQHLELPRRVVWADVAARFGFFDQAHLVREFRALTNSTPSEYLTRRGPYLNYLTVP